MEQLKSTELLRKLYNTRERDLDKQAGHTTLKGTDIVWKHNLTFKNSVILKQPHLISMYSPSVGHIC